MLGGWNLGWHQQLRRDVEADRRLLEATSLMLGLQLELELAVVYRT